MMGFAALNPSYAGFRSTGNRSSVSAVEGSPAVPTVLAAQPPLTHSGLAANWIGEQRLLKFFVLGGTRHSALMFDSRMTRPYSSYCLRM
jgi:hypothetical protein